MTRVTCLLCGATSADADVRTALVEWAEPHDGRLFTSMPRCVDREGCRSRCEANGERWPVAEPERKRRGVAW